MVVDELASIAKAIFYEPGFKFSTDMHWNFVRYNASFKCDGINKTSKWATSRLPCVSGRAKNLLQSCLIHDWFDAVINLLCCGAVISKISSFPVTNTCSHGTTQDEASVSLTKHKKSLLKSLRSKDLFCNSCKNRLTNWFILTHWPLLFLNLNFRTLTVKWLFIYQWQKSSKFKLFSNIFSKIDTKFIVNSSFLSIVVDELTIMTNV